MTWLEWFLMILTYGTATIAAIAVLVLIVFTGIAIVMLPSLYSRWCQRKDFSHHYENMTSWQQFKSVFYDWWRYDLAFF